MDLDADEDVVFENSPLYAHLKEVGYTEFHSEPITHLEYPQNNKSELTTGNMWQKFKESCMDGAFMQFLSLISILFWKKIEDFWHNTFFSGKTKNFNALYVKLLLFSNLVLEEDGRFLKRFDPSTFVFEDVNYDGLGLHINKAKGALKFHRHKLLGSSFMSVLVLAIAVLCSFSNVTSMYYSGYFILILFGICTFAILCGLFLLKYWSIYQWYSTCFRNSLILKEYIDTMKLLYAQLRKSILLIQEVELISRGFTVFTPGTPISRMENNHNAPSRQFVSLRKTVLKTAKILILKLRNGTLLLLNGFPLSCEVDNDEMYITRVPLKSLGPFFDEGLSEMNLSNATNEYSLESLKTIFNLLQVQQSEFVRRFLLTLSPSSYENGSYDEKRKINARIYSLFKDIVDPEKDVLHKLKQSYDFHKTRIADSVKPRENFHQKTEGNKWSPLIFATHSLDLHLQVVLSKLRSFENIIDRLENTTEDGSTDDDEYSDIVINHKDREQLNSLYNQVKGELDAAKECWEVGAVKLKLLLGASQVRFSCIEKEQNDPSDLPQGSHVPAPEVAFADFSDMELSDQIFEGYTDPSNIECDGWNEPILTAADLEKERKEMEENKRMMKELKSILTAKANPDGIGLISFDTPLVPQTERFAESEVSDKCDGQMDTSLNKEDRTGACAENELTEIPSELSLNSNNDADGQCHQKEEIESQIHPTAEETNLPAESSENSVILTTSVDERLLQSIESNIVDGSQSADKHVFQPIRSEGYCGSLARSVAMAAAARSKAFGYSEQKFESEDVIADEET